MDEKLLQFIGDVVKEYFSDQPVKVYLFGSRVRNENRLRSDYDLAFDLPDSKEKSRFFLKIVDDAPTLCGIDAVDLDEVSDTFKKKILEEGKIIYES
ncbi:MAG: nucleotidyltransferase domain-containing protein [Gammaproteobacteria bacterium]